MAQPRQLKKQEKEKDAVPDINEAEAHRLVESLAVVVMDTIKHYWLSPTDAESALNETFAILGGILETCPRVSFRVIGGALSVNGKPIEESSQAIKTFVDQMTDLGIDNFAIEEKIAVEELHRFHEIVTMLPDQFRNPDGLKGHLDKHGIKHITCKKMIYKELVDGEITVSEKLLRQRGPGGGEGEGEGPGSGGILAFLKGDISLSDDKAAAAAREAASDPAKMAELILKASVIQAKEASVDGGETLGDFVVGCLRRTYQAITEDPAFETQRGKKKAVRDLVILEEEILNRMRDMKDPPCSAADIESITSATEEITEEVQIDAIADDYVDKITAGHEAEAKLIEFMKAGEAKGFTEAALKQKLEEHGLTSSGWHDLVIKSGIGRGTGADGAGGGGSGGISHILEAINHLDVLLDKMEKEFDRVTKSAQEQNAKEMVTLLQNVSGDIRKLTSGTGAKIQSLIAGLQQDAAIVSIVEDAVRKSGKKLSVSRSQILETISDIVREITEPLELIRTSLDMMNSKVFDSNPEMQANVAKVMLENADIAKALLENLRTISAGGQKK